MIYKYFYILIALLIISPGTIRANAPTPDVFISSTNLLQGDTLLVIVKNETDKITGTFGSIKLKFFRDESEKNWVAITGAPLNKNPNSYKISINIPNKEKFENNIIVSKKDFPTTVLKITPELSKKGYSAKSVTQNILNKENIVLNNVLNITNPKTYISKPFIYPLSQIKNVGAFGNIRKSATSALQHLGVDLEAPLNTPVYSVNDGKVVFAKKMTDYGNTLIIDHGLGVYSLYLHLNTFKVKKGQTVKQGDKIALSGNTGYSIAPHLHFSIKVRGASLDPLEFIETTKEKW